MVLSPKMQIHAHTTWPILTYHKVSDDTGEDEDTQEGKRYDEEVKVAVVSSSHTVPNPWTVVVKPLWKGRTYETFHISRGQLCKSSQKSAFLGQALQTCKLEIF